MMIVIMIIVVVVVVIIIIVVVIVFVIVLFHLLLLLLIIIVIVSIIVIISDTICQCVYVCVQKEDLTQKNLECDSLTASLLRLKEQNTHLVSHLLLTANTPFAVGNSRFNSLQSASHQSCLDEDLGRLRKKIDT